jgi:hypothetical protein
MNFWETMVLSKNTFLFIIVRKLQRENKLVNAGLLTIGKKQTNKNLFLWGSYPK